MTSLVFDLFGVKSKDINNQIVLVEESFLYNIFYNQESKSLEFNSNSGLGLGTFLGKTLLERQNAKLIFKDDKNLGGASVVISWSPKNIIL